MIFSFVLAKNPTPADFALNFPSCHESFPFFLLAATRQRCRKMLARL